MECDCGLIGTCVDCSTRDLRSSLAAAEARVKALEGALEAILREPYGCQFCDSGTLRTHSQMMKDAFPGHILDATEHAAGCGYALARAALRPAGEAKP